MHKAVLVRVITRGLCLESDESVLNEFVHFDQLPWIGETNRHLEDINYTHPYLSNKVVSSAFNAPSFQLESGVHLHWILPHFLGEAQADNSFPAVPNRWRITKLDSAENVVEEWVVMSDFVHTQNNGGSNNAILFPLPQEKRKAGIEPYLRVGKRIPLANYSDDDVESTFMETFGKKLTVLGYGNTHFSASYVNCHSVFGFHDENGSLENSYQIIGWHTRPDDDVIVKAFMNYFEEDSYERFRLQGRTIEPDCIHDLIDETFQLIPDTSSTPSPADNLSDSPEVEVPLETLYVGRISIDSKPEKKSIGNIAVGNTVTEAITALSAHQLYPDDKDVKERLEAENQLEYFGKYALMSGYHGDHNAKFYESRHSDGFTRIRGAATYALNIERLGKTSDFLGYDLPSCVPGLVTSISSKQEKLGEIEVTISQLKEQLFTDWYKYMLIAYSDTSDTQIDGDHLMHFIEHSSLNEIDYYTSEQRNPAESIESDYRLLQQIFQSTIQEKILEQESIIEEWRDAIPANVLGLTSVALHKRLLDTKSHAEQLKLQQQISQKNEAEKGIELAEAIIAKLTEERRQVNETLQSNPFPLKKMPGNAYWQPKEPVFAFDGFDFGDLTNKSHYKFASNTGTSLIPAIASEDFFEKQLLSDQSWCPFLMEWDIEFDSRSISPNDPESFFTNHTLSSDSPDILEKKPLKKSFKQAPTFKGRCVLQPESEQLFLNGLANFINYCINQDTTAGKYVNDVTATGWQKQLNTAFKALLNTASEKYWTELIKNLTNRLGKDIKTATGELLTIKQAQHDFWSARKEKATGSNMLCQKISGFNEYLHMLETSPQLQIAAPVGFRAGKEFTAKVREKSAESRNFAPLPDHYFMPVRSGCLSVNKLQFVDNFGRALKLESSPDCIVANALIKRELDITKTEVTIATDQALLSDIYLPPRILQPAKSTVSFLQQNGNPIDEAQKETPILGWIVPDFIDRSVLIYAPDGSAILTIASDGTKTPPPWDSTPPPPNYYLEQVINQIRDLKVEVFLDAIMRGQRDVVPANFVLDSPKELIVGNAIAITLVQYRLDLQSAPAIEQSWTALVKDMNKTWPMSSEDVFLGIAKREGNDWNAMQFPLRLGDPGQLNDGVIGYWKEDDGTLEPTYYGANVTATAPSPPTDLSYIHRVTANGTANNFVVLMAPKGLIHFTTGILPTTILSIPSQTYISALEKMKLWFQIDPLLHYKNSDPKNDGATSDIDITLPSIPDYEWTVYDATTENTIKTKNPVQKSLYTDLPEVKHLDIVLQPKTSK